MRHELKTWPEYYQKVKSGEKTFELRKNDRPFQVLDILVLQEWDPINGYSGDETQVVVIYVFRGTVPNMGLMDGFCIMAVKLIDK